MKHLHLLLSAIAVGLFALCLTTSPILTAVFVLAGVTGYLYIQLIKSGHFNYLPLGEGAALYAPASVWGR